eukprot:TRINITY_DN2833_c0_g2_i5.p1 TRINITY_DN2833_c0_g2~~TRINITY_DN2833_c0_g2_i5.p1  ORF type:complete len:138 (-),score=10.74 TRINITY_DN2833_c0_g2_i5:493-906(-)
MSHSKVLIVEQAVTKTVVAPSPPKSQSTGMPLKLMLSLVRDNPSLILYFYSHLLQTKPIKTKAISAAIINIIGNIINQTVFEKKLRGLFVLSNFSTSFVCLFVANLFLRAYTRWRCIRSLSRRFVWSLRRYSFVFHS